MPEQRITARIRGTAVLPSMLDIGIAGNNRVDAVSFVWDGSLPEALSGTAGRAYLKQTAGAELLKIPLEATNVDEKPAYVWTILSDHVPSGGTHRAQLQIEAAEEDGGEPEGAFILWQTMAFQIKAGHTISADVQIGRQEQPILLQLFSRIDGLTTLMDETIQTMQLGLSTQGERVDEALQAVEGIIGGVDEVRQQAETLLSTVEEDLTGLKDAVDGFSDELDALRDELRHMLDGSTGTAHLEARLVALEERVSLIRAEVQDGLEAQGRAFDAFSERMAALVSTVASLDEKVRGDLAGQDGKLSTFEDGIASAQSALSELSARVGAEASGYVARLSALESGMADFDDQLALLQSQLAQGLQDQDAKIETLGGMLSGLSAVLSQAREDAEDALATQRDRLDDLEGALESAKKSMESTRVLAEAVSAEAIRGILVGGVALAKSPDGTVEIPVSSETGNLFSRAEGQIVPCFPVANSKVYVSAATQACHLEHAIPSPLAPVPIVGWDEVELTRCAQNLYNYMAADYVADGIDVKPMATGVRLVATSTDSQRNAAIYFLPPIENQMITFRATIAQTGVNNGCCQLAWMDRGNRMIGQPLMSETATTNRRVFTVGEKPVWDARLCLLLYINYDASQAVGDVMEYKSIQVSLGDVSGAFLTYDGQTYTFRPPAPLYGLEGAADTMSNEGVITRRSCYKVFSGSEAFSFKLNTNPEYCSIYMSGTAFPEALRPVDYSAGMQFLCSHLPFSKKVSSGYVDRTENGITGYNDRSAAFIMTFRRDQIGNPSSASGFAAWAREQADAGTPLALCYPLANPVIEQIEGQDIAALVGLNTVYETGWPVSVAWYHVLPPGMGLEYRG